VQISLNLIYITAFTKGVYIIIIIVVVKCDRAQFGNRLNIKFGLLLPIINVPGAAN